MVFKFTWLFKVSSEGTIRAKLGKVFSFENGDSWTQFRIGTLNCNLASIEVGDPELTLTMWTNTYVFELDWGYNFAKPFVAFYSRRVKPNTVGVNQCK
jgi:hypothetical protein